jgi:phage terminase small subunit
MSKNYPHSQNLTPKQERFVAEYLVDLNATQAAIRAGYSRKTASRIGPERLAESFGSGGRIERCDPG